MPEFRLHQMRPMTERVAEFTWHSAEGACPTWTPGAHVDVDLGELGTRSYSLIRWPNGDRADLTFAVQLEPQGMGGSRAMHELDAGGVLTLSDPKNDFALAPSAKPAALIAGGIGVTPLISMATELAAQSRAFVFHYAGRTAPAMAYLDRLRAEFGDHLTVHTDDAAPMDIPNILEALHDHALYICGPKGMIDAVRKAAEAVGVPPGDVHVELFSVATAEDDTAFEIELASSGEVVPVAADQSIIAALEAAGHDVMYDCQRGDCGICQVDVLDGTPDHRDVVLSEGEKSSGKVIQICVSRAKSPRLVLDL